MTHKHARHTRRPLTALNKLPAPWRRSAAWLVPAAAVAGAAIGGVYGLVKAPEYTATSYVIAVPTKGAPDPSAAIGFAQAYGRVATQLAVFWDAQMWADVPVATLRESVQASTSPDAPMVAISATSTRPDQARSMAVAVSEALTKHANTSAEKTGIKLVGFSRALEPVAPSSASPALTALVGGSAGGLLGGLALLVRPRREGDDGELEEPTGTALPSPAMEDAASVGAGTRVRSATASESAAAKAAAQAKVVKVREQG
ncbi:lipopolysaccharide biosynthesis protein [Streptomyces polyrhachis]|uniref:Lipopolysaccharide biosynthesis protein n=1 Tax=Streptomyces polyrhachis TaxID=1282885 RepID=A0ABW2GJN5_9ACTN